MKILQYGDRGGLVSLLQKGLQRAGYDPGVPDGVFGRRTQQALQAFQRSVGLTPDGRAGVLTQRALEPWYLGYTLHRVQPGESLWRIARRYGSTLLALETANPGLDPFALMPGSTLTVPFSFPVVPGDIPVSGELAAYCVRGLAGRYPFLVTGRAGESVLGQPLWTLRWGTGPRRVFYHGGIHGNEWITTLLLLRFAEALCIAYAGSGEVFGAPARQLWERSEITLLPLANPDGADVVTGSLSQTDAEEQARALAAAWPGIPYPEGWKANIRGVDLNLQFPAGWEQARDIKFAQGYTRAGPRDYVGTAPLTEPESRALYDYTLALDPALILAYHTQGEVIYWKYLDYEPAGSRELAARFAAVSGYSYEETPYASAFAGYKDWFIQEYNRPGYTVEAGLGENPLPIAQLEEIYQRNLGILVLGADPTL